MSIPPEQVNNIINREIELIKRYANWLNNDIASFNNSLDSIIDNGLLNRRQKLSRDEVFLGHLSVQKQALTTIGF